MKKALLVLIAVLSVLLFVSCKEAASEEGMQPIGIITFGDKSYSNSGTTFTDKVFYIYDFDPQFILIPLYEKSENGSLCYRGWNFGIDFTTQSDVKIQFGGLEVDNFASEFTSHSNVIFTSRSDFQGITFNTTDKISFKLQGNKGSFVLQWLKKPVEMRTGY